MNKIDLILTEMSGKSEKIENNNDPVNENTDFGYFRPVFGILWPLYQRPKLSMSVSDLVLAWLSEINKKILNNNDLFD